jgi:hypothetical protein
MLNFTYEDDIKIKSKHVAGISRTFHLSIETLSRPPQSRETIPLKWLKRNCHEIFDLWFFFIKQSNQSPCEYRAELLDFPQLLSFCSSVLGSHYRTMLFWLKNFEVGNCPSPGFVADPYLEFPERSVISHLKPIEIYSIRKRNLKSKWTAP